MLATPAVSIQESINFNLTPLLCLIRNVEIVRGGSYCKQILMGSEVSFLEVMFTDLMFLNYMPYNPKQWLG